MVLVSVSIHEARVSSTFFGGLKASRRWNLKKIIILENIKSNELSLVFSKIVSKGLCCDKVWGISIFPSCTPVRGIYRKSLLSFFQQLALKQWLYLLFKIKIVLKEKCKKTIKNNQVLIKRTELLVTQGKCDITLNLSDYSTLPHLREVWN